MMMTSIVELAGFLKLQINVQNRIPPRIQVIQRVVNIHLLDKEYF
jgi:hypothetical protein